MAFDEDDFLQLSGIQHFKFCRRQWALIHIESQWAENERTVSGELMHERAHDYTLREKRGDTLTIRNLRVFSASLGVSGVCDVVEFYKNINGVELTGEDNLYLPFPIEYKLGAPRQDMANELQLCAQAICLEEMLCCDIPSGALYYGKTRRREIVDFTNELRKEVKELFSQMHELYNRGQTPKVKPTKSCSACSLKEICLPKLMRQKSVKNYFQSQMGDSL